MQSRLTIQDGFLAAGEISKSKDGKKINSCPDLRETINRTKNNSILSNANTFIDKAHKMSILFAKHGECAELQYETVYKIDVCP